MTFFNLDQTSLPVKQKLLQVETRLAVKTVQWNCNHRKLLIFPAEVFSVSNQSLGKTWVQWLSWAKLERFHYSLKRFWMVQVVVKARNIRIVITAQTLTFPMICTIQFLCALKPEQWREDNADPSENRGKFTKCSGTAGCCYMAQIVNSSPRYS